MYRATYQDDNGDWWVLDESRSYDREWAKVFAKDWAVFHDVTTALEVYDDPDPRYPEEAEPVVCSDGSISEGAGWFVERTFWRTDSLALAAERGGAS